MLWCSVCELLGEDAVHLAPQFIDEGTGAFALVVSSGSGEFAGGTNELAETLVQVLLRFTDSPAVVPYGFGTLGLFGEEIASGIGDGVGGGVIVFALGDHETLFGESAKNGVDRAGAWSPAIFGALGDLADQAVAIGWPVGEQDQESQLHVAASGSGSAAASGIAHGAAPVAWAAVMMAAVAKSTSDLTQAIGTGVEIFSGVFCGSTHVGLMSFR